MADRKPTKKEVITKMLSDERINSVKEYKEFLEKELASLNKRAENKKPTKTQEENKKLAEAVLEVMVGVEKITATEIMEKVEGIGSNQKATAILKTLKEEGKVERLTEGKKTYFKLA